MVIKQSDLASLAYLWLVMGAIITFWGSLVVYFHKKSLRLEKGKH